MLSMLCFGFYIAVVSWLTLQQVISAPILIGLASLNLLSFCLYGLDKWFAIKNWGRVPEIKLHFFTLLGGWAGAIVGQHLFHHKTKKQPFRRIFFILVIVNSAAIYYLLSPLPL